MISICMGYYNRKPQLLRTIESIQKSTISDFELVIVDDGSVAEHRLEDLDYDFLKLIRIEPEDRTWVNPCIAYNKAIKAATGDTIVIQNPECYHFGDVLESVSKRIRSYNYLSFACLSLSETMSPDHFTLPNHTAAGNGAHGWYNHSVYSPRAYHFCCAITRENILKLNGFDERFANGLCFDDEELVQRIKSLGLSIQFVDSPFVLHQWHDCSHIFQPESVALSEINRDLFVRIMKGEESKWK